MKFNTLFKSNYADKLSYLFDLIELDIKDAGKDLQEEKHNVINSFKEFVADYISWFNKVLFRLGKTPELGTKYIALCKAIWDSNADSFNFRNFDKYNNEYMRLQGMIYGDYHEIISKNIDYYSLDSYISDCVFDLSVIAINRGRIDTNDKLIQYIVNNYNIEAFESVLDYMETRWK